MHRIPAKAYLSGADYFNLLVERNLGRLGYYGNIIHVALDLDGYMSLKELSQLCQSKEMLPWLNAYELKTPYPMAVPYWKRGRKGIPLPMCEVIETDSVIPEVLLELDLKPEAGKLFHLALVQRSNGFTRVVLSAHHAIIDNRGMQMLVDFIGSPENKMEVDIFPERQEKASVVQRMKEFNEARHFLMDADQNVAGLLSGKTKPNLKSQYTMINFSEAETQRIDENGVKVGARFGNGPFFLASAARAVNGIMTQRETAGKIIWIPVPQNQRMRGGKGALLSNQISFMFYRIPHKKLSSIHDAVREFSEQMVQQVRTKMPQSYATMMNIFRRLPLAAYNFFMKLPTKGVVTTFSFSDLGDSLPDTDVFLRRRILDVHHYPPNPVPPGFTVVFMRFQNRLRVVVGNTEQSMSPAELVNFEKLLRSDLLQESAS